MTQGATQRAPDAWLVVVAATVAVVLGLSGCAETVPGWDAAPSTGAAVASGSTPEATAEPPTGRPARTEVVEITRGDVVLQGTLEVPELADGQRVPLAILMHGWQSWRDEPHLVRTAEQLAAAGIASLRVDFTGQGLSEGEVDDFADAASVEVSDARAIVGYAADLDFVDGVSLVGYSLGGLVAAMTAGDLGSGDGGIASVVLLAPAPAYGIYLPVYATAGDYAGPVLILQGDSDALVSVEVAERYAAALTNSELRVLPHENHSFTYGTDVEAMTVAFIASSTDAVLKGYPHS